MGTLHLNEYCQALNNSHINEALLSLLCCSQTGEPLYRQGRNLITESGRNHYIIDANGIPVFAGQFCSTDAEFSSSTMTQLQMRM